MASEKGVLVDITRCVGCGSCMVACRLYNNLKPVPDRQPIKAGNGQGEQKEKLKAGQWTIISVHEVEVNGKKARRFVKEQCLHCHEPACASACFARALAKTPEGPVVYNEKLCVGCRYCMLACPFNIPKFEWDKSFPRIEKCQMCYNRVKEGEMPACVGVCPTRALMFGERQALLQEARRRIASDSRYVKKVYGEKEVGGTSWLYLSDVPFEQLGFKTNLTEKPLPEYTFAVLKWTPAVAIGWGAILTGLHLYTRRREEVANKEGKK